MPIKKGLRPSARKTEATKDVRPRLAIVEEIMMLTAPKWDGKKFKKTMTLLEACNQVGISDLTFRNWRVEDTKIGDYVENLKQARKEMQHTMMKEYALNNVMNAVSGAVKLRPMDVVNVSLRYLEKTDSDFNQSIKVDVEDKTNPLLSMSKDEITQRIMELSSSLNITNNTTHDTIYSTAICSAITEKQTGDGEIESEGSL